MILRYVPGPGLDAINHGEIKPVLPLLFDLSSDPHEDNNLWIGMVNGWVYGPMLEVLDRFEKSVEEYPNIKPGEEFTGYKTKGSHSSPPVEPHGHPMGQ